MAAKFDLNDDSVVVIIGSGAGGGTLGNELAQKGINVVILEAGARHEYEDFVNDEWASFAQLAWTDMRTTSGSLARRQGLPDLAGLDRQGGRRLDHALGRRVAALPGARVQDADHLRPRSRAPTSSTGRSRSPSSSPTTPRPRTRWASPAPAIARPARQQQLQGPEGRRRQARLQGMPHRQHGDQFAPSATAAAPASRSASASRAASGAPNGRRSTPRSRRARRPASWRCGPRATSCASSTTPRARSRAWSMPTRTASSSARRRASSRSPATRSKARASC